MELAFVEEEIPKITRPGGSGREAEPWETHLSPLKADDKVGKSFRVWSYAKRSSAVSRMTAVRDRLNKAVPAENWKLAVRVVPGTEKAEAPDYGVYVSFAGLFTPDEMLENAKAHQERSERVRASRQVTVDPVQAAADRGDNETATRLLEAEVAEQPSAKERVAAARAAK